MRVRRLVLVTRRFWPLVGGAEKVMANLGAALAERGLQVTVLTARWDRSWPATLTYRGASVVRLRNPPQRFWGTLRYMIELRRWLRRHRARYEAIYVSMLKHDAFAVLGAAGGRMPVLLRAEGAGEGGDCRWQEEARCGQLIRRRCRQADALVAPSRLIEEELLAAGYPPERVHYVPNSVPLPPARDDRCRQAARAALAEGGGLPEMPVVEPLVVYTGRLHEAKGLDDLVTAWRTVAQRMPQARLWMAGEGPHRDRLAERIAAGGLEGRAVLAGTFDRVDDLLAAADAFVLPSLEEGMSLSLLEAMAAGLPVVASAIPANRALVEHEVQGILVPAGVPAALARAIERVLADRELADRLGVAGRRLVAEEFSLDAWVDTHLALIEGLLPPSPHVGSTTPSS